MISFANRLARDLDEKSVIELTADIKLELLDAINGGLQTLHSIAPVHSKMTTGSIPLEAPISTTLGVTNGSVEVTGILFTIDQFYRTIRISGDTIDNQIIGETKLLHPFSGVPGTVAATIYCDGVAIPEPYEEMVGHPRILETNTLILPAQSICQVKEVSRPRFYSVESNARNQDSVAPSVIRFNTLPDRGYRIESKFTLAPLRVGFADLVSPVEDIPLRAEHVEAYLLPISRGLLTHSSLWKDKETKAQALAEADTAEKKYEKLTPNYLSTPRSFIRTTRGF